MARNAKRALNPEEIRQRRADLLKALEATELELRAAEEAARDAGRATLLTALDRVKIVAMEKSAASAIARAIATHGGAAVAEAVVKLDTQAS